MSEDDNGSAPTTETEKKDYEILREDYPNYDLSFKVIVIGNSGNFNFIFNII